MRKIHLLVFLILFIITASFAVIKQDWSTVEVKPVKVAGNVYMLESPVAGNIGVLIGENGVLMVDDQFAPLADKIKAAITEVGGDAPRFLLNTHWHRDHTDGNAIFASEATIIAHDNVRQRLSTTQHVMGRTTEPAPENAWPVITFGQSLSIHFNGEEIKAIHYPKGHTDGDAVIYFTGSNVVHMGDQFFANVFPFIDFETGGSLDGYIKNIETILEELPEDVKIIPGHGPVSDLQDLKKFHQMLVETTDDIHSRMQAGKSLEEIQSEGLAEKWQSWSWSFITTERWIELVYNGYQETAH